jgi:hypothetical protein
MGERIVIRPTRYAVEPGNKELKFVVAKLLCLFFEQKYGEYFSSRFRPEKSLSATCTTKFIPCSRAMLRRACVAAFLSAAVYQPCDLISSLKNHCTPSACSADPPSLSMRRICSATRLGVVLRLSMFSLLRRDGGTRPQSLVVNPEQGSGRDADSGYSPPDSLRLMRDLAKVVD